jgi:hypothetical protein
VKQVKLWLLGKCLGVSLHSQDLANVGTKDAVSSHSGHSAFGGGNAVVPTPAHRYRPASPITFAPDPRKRPISPILFAKAGSKTKGKGASHTTKNPSKAMLTGGDHRYIHGDDENGVDGEGIGGYEEDDEWDSGDEDTDDAGDDLGGVDAKRSAPEPNHNPVSPSVSQPPNVKLSLLLSSNINDKYNTVPSTYSLLRFSTGQKLEDEYQLSWYDLAQNELLELHAHAPVQNLPATFGLSSINPVNSVTSKPRHAQKSTQHARSGSTSSLSRLPSRSHANAPNGRSDPPQPLPTRIYFPSLNRASLSSYVQPYWEGYVRALRLVWHDDSTRKFPHPSYGNSVGEAFAGGFVPAFAVFGQDQAGRDSGAMEREAVYGGYGKAYAEMHGNGAASAKPKRTRLEWRLRWALFVMGCCIYQKIAR